ncbi:hypothetical protein GGS24DRAFT_484835 [Hypoxylon argillaceum]|nr:hypothetical protein GGS24DRAFT_484835 [Hypoxylon argillaceum]
MPPSLSAVERGNPPPRRKSCAACIKAKRRCDLRQPSCLRCSQRKIDCAYPEGIRRSSSNTTSSPAVMSPAAQAQEFMKDPLAEMVSWEASFDFNMDLSPSSSSYNPACTSFPTMAFDTPAIPGLEFFDEVVNMDDTLGSMSPTPGLGLELEPEEPLPIVLRSPKPQIASLPRIQLLRAASELIEKRLSYSLDTFKRAPEEMVLEGGTPWSHPALYQESMPTCLEDALGACALHRAKNAKNSAVIQRVLELRYQKLVTAPIPPAAGAADLMARTHALILYQIMLFFDDASSCAARALAEETISALGDSAMALMAFVRHESEDDEGDSSAADPARNIPLYPLTAARALYHDWTFQESLRRTLLVAFLLTQLQCLMRADFSTFMAQSFAAVAAATGEPPASMADPPSCVSSADASTIAAIRHAMQESPLAADAAKCDPRLLLCRSLTLSAHLWHARDPVQFAVAWRDKKHLVAHPWNIWRRIDAAQPDDIDQLGRILMTSGMGIDEAKGWFASKGGRL